MNKKIKKRGPLLCKYLRELRCYIEPIHTLTLDECFIIYNKSHSIKKVVQNFELDAWEKELSEEV